MIFLIFKLLLNKDNTRNQPNLQKKPIQFFKKSVIFACSNPLDLFPHKIDFGSAILIYFFSCECIPDHH